MHKQNPNDPDSFVWVSTVTVCVVKDVQFMPLTWSLEHIANGDKHWPIKFIWYLPVYQDRVIHECVLTIAQLEEGKRVFDVGDDCTLRFVAFELVEKPSFVDFLRSGWQIGLTFAIDYTASNGQAENPDSLHNLGPNNKYIEAISSVGAICEPYDNDKKFPTFGFGGIHRGMEMDDTSHCFPINGNVRDPSILGIEGVTQAYGESLQQIELAGPTYFAPLLQDMLKRMERMDG